MKTIVEILQEAKGLVDTPEKWTTFELARNADGNKVTHHSPDATCFCAIGATLRAMHNNGWRYGKTTLEMNAYDMLNPAVEKLREGVDFTSKNPHEDASWNTPRFNDHETTRHGDILELFDTAIELHEGNAT